MSPASASEVPSARHVPASEGSSSSVEPTSGRSGLWNSRLTRRASTGAPLSKSVTSATNSFGPIAPGSISSRTFVVVAKSEPVATRGPCAFACPGSSDPFGGRPVRIPVTANTHAARASSAPTVRSSGLGPSEENLGTLRNRFTAPSATSGTTRASLATSAVR